MKFRKKQIVENFIPDFDHLGISSKLDIRSDSPAIAIHLEVDIDHPFPTDLHMELFNPQGDKTLNFSPGDLHLNEENLFHFHSEIDLQSISGEWILKVSDTGIRDTGTLVGWQLAFEIKNPVLSNIFIEDLSSLEFLWNYEGLDHINTLELELEISHSHVSDIFIELAHLHSNKSYVIHNREGIDGENLTIRKITNDFKKLEDINPNGDWILRISDALKGDEGMVKRLHFQVNELMQKH